MCAQKIALLLLVFTLLVIGNVQCLWPKPQQITYGTQVVQISDPCSIQYHVQQHGSDYPPDYVEQIIGIYHKYAFTQSLDQCKKNVRKLNQMMITKHQFSNNNDNDGDTNIFFDMRIVNWDLKGSTQVQDENYTLIIQNSTYWFLQAQTYFAFVRALETYAQLIESNQAIWEINNTTLSIIDYPNYSYRGIMIDTSRHYLQQDTIYNIIITMMFNKLNVLHWHITDDQSFPWEVTAYPDLANNTKYGPDMYYSKQTIQDIVQFALQRGVRIVPEIDTPGHSRSWYYGKLTENITLLCSSSGQVDPTMDYTYTVLYNMFTELNQIFVDEFVHFGGDEVEYSCWDKRTDIKKFMKEHSIPDYPHLQLYFRAQEKSVWKDQIKANKSIMYWNNEAVNEKPSDDDIVQWWGAQGDIANIKNFTNRIVVSSSDLLYLNIGYGEPGINVIPWRTIYEQLTLNFSDFKGTILGPEATLWAEVNSDETSLNKLWMRASVVAERAWNYHANDGQPNQVDLVKRLVAMSEIHHKRGFQTEPVTTEFCSRNVDVCFTNH